MEAIIARTFVPRVRISGVDSTNWAVVWLRTTVEITVTKEVLGCCLPGASRKPKSTKHVERTLSSSLDQGSIPCGSTLDFKKEARFNVFIYVKMAFLFLGLIFTQTILKLMP